MFRRVICVLIIIIVFVSVNGLEFIILHTNDHHGNLLSYRIGEYEVAGLAERAYIIRRLIENNENYLLLDAGDINTGRFESMFFDAEPDIVAYNLIGYDAVTLGNHEFYGGLGRLFEQMRWAYFPFLSANVFISEHELLTDAYIVKELPNGLKVAVFGLTTPTLLSSQLQFSEQIIVRDYVEIANELVPQLRAKADVVIALTHLGIFEHCEEFSFGSVRLAREVKGIDLIIDGHSHTVLERPLYINGTPIVQAGERGRQLGKAIISHDKETDEFRLTKWTNISLMRALEDPAFRVDTAVFDVVQVFREKIPATYRQIIGFSNIHYCDTNIRNTITPLGQLIADTMMHAFNTTDEEQLLHSGADLAFTNGGGIRASLSQGEIRYFDLREILPFENNVVLVEISGETLLEIINFSMETMINRGGFLQFSSNVRLFQSDDGWHALIDGEALRANEVYRVATNSYLASGGDSYAQFFSETIPLKIGVVEIIALREYIQARF